MKYKLKDLVNTYSSVRCVNDRERMRLLEVIENNYPNAKWCNGEEKPTQFVANCEYIVLRDLNSISQSHMAVGTWWCNFSDVILRDEFKVGDRVLQKCLSGIATIIEVRDDSELCYRIEFDSPSYTNEWCSESELLKIEEPAPGMYHVPSGLDQHCVDAIQYAYGGSNIGTTAKDMNAAYPKRKKKGGKIMSLIRKLMDKDLALLQEESVIDYEGNLNLDNDLLQEVLYDMTKEALIAKVKAKIAKEKKDNK